MKDTIHLDKFQDRMKAIAGDSFSFEGLQHLFEYLEQIEDETGVEIEFYEQQLSAEYTEIKVSEHLAQDGSPDALVCSWTDVSGERMCIVGEG